MDRYTQARLEDVDAGGGVECPTCASDHIEVLTADSFACQECGEHFGEIEAAEADVGIRAYPPTWTR